MKLHSTLPPAMPEHHRGFTLVEVMVAMVIGMLGLIIMMQVFSAAEGQRRATTGSGDAQSNGAMALYALQRDIRQGGYGFNAVNTFGCPLALPAPASRTLAQLAPVIINPPTADVPAGDANTDTLLIAYGNNEGPPEGDVITAVNGSLLAVAAATNYRTGQQVIAAPSAPTAGCALTLTDVSAPPTPPNVPVRDATGAVDGGTLFNLGANPRFLAYAIRGGNLTVCDYLAFDCSSAANYIAIANNIVSLRAQYGHASTDVSGVDVWDQQTPPLTTDPPIAAPTTATEFACLWARTSALRIAIVARNSQLERDQITAVAPLWAGSAGAALTLSGRANWQNYRYKVFETIIPIRNLPWMGTCT
ncbi:PilW family protein [Candidatus Accumulibacter sp. ACC012]|jgi:type IV pilus assembly protein PilW|uniref:PilW family protein n=1 Tax=Candidatus Accumulibacter sp. ACC012 TaxID=2823332 RepID=UPI0025BE148F|nr:PilW family protein [Candidatus Accumulibacter sp. ACC012]